MRALCFDFIFWTPLHLRPKSTAVSMSKLSVAIKKYSLLAILPSTVAFLIWADWSHTRDWKAANIHQNTKVFVK